MSNRSAPGLDVQILKNQAMAMWRMGAGDTLVKIVARGAAVPGQKDVGYCTTLKFIVGRDPEEMEDILGFARGTRLLNGADIFRIDPLPSRDQFELKAYSYLPDGVPQMGGKVINPLFPPGKGAPQWKLVNYPWSLLKKLATVLPGEKFVCRYDSLPASVPAVI